MYRYLHYYGLKRNKIIIAFNSCSNILENEIKGKLSNSVIIISKIKIKILILLALVKKTLLANSKTGDIR